MISIPLDITRAHPCSYLDGESAQSIFVNPAYPMTTAVYSRLIEQGFRRSGDDVYKPGCPICSACMPTRLPVNRFNPSRNQKRCLKNNQNTQAILKPPIFEQAHYDMFLRYQAARHDSGDMANSSSVQYIDFLSSSWCDTQFIEFSISGALAAVAVIDRLDNALSAVYTFFEPELSSYSLGTYAVLWQIERALHEKREFVYLGFWIKECKKMAYKNQFQPMQVLVNNQWLPF